MNEKTKFIRVYNLAENKDYIININHISYMCYGEYGEGKPKPCGVIKVDLDTVFISLEAYKEIQYAIFIC